MPPMKSATASSSTSNDSLELPSLLPGEVLLPSPKATYEEAMHHAEWLNSPSWTQIRARKRSQPSSEKFVL